MTENQPKIDHRITALSAISSDQELNRRERRPYARLLKDFEKHQELTVDTVEAQKLCVDALKYLIAHPEQLDPNTEVSEVEDYAVLQENRARLMWMNEQSTEEGRMKAARKFGYAIIVDSKAPVLGYTRKERKQRKLEAKNKLVAAER